MISDNDQWAIILKSKVLKSYGTIKYHIFSSLCSSIKENVVLIYNIGVWLVGCGENIKFWMDRWYGPPHIDDTSISFLSSNNIVILLKIAYFFMNGQRLFTSGWYSVFPFLQLRSFPILLPAELGFIFWPHTLSDDLTLKEAFM